MPLVEVHLAAGRSDAQKKALLLALTEAVHASIGSPVESIRVWINEIPRTEFMSGGTLLADRPTPTPAGPPSGPLPSPAGGDSPTT